MDEAELEHRLTEVENRSKSNTKRLDSMENATAAISDLATSIKVMTIKLDQTISTVEKLDGKVDEIEGKPGKRYDRIVENIIWACVAAVITYVLSHVGFGT